VVVQPDVLPLVPGAEARLGDARAEDERHRPEGPGVDSMISADIFVDKFLS
jgi:hypothetical protein